MISTKSSFAWLFFLMVLCFLCNPSDVHAQFIDLQLNIETELTAKTEQPLNFGTLASDTGRREINFGSTNMGLFSITALENQLLLIHHIKPTKLTHDNPDIDDVVPVQLSIRYGFSSTNFENSFSLSENGGNIKVGTNPDPGPWNTIYLFIYGFIDIGNIAGGVYDNEIVLDIEYI